MKAFLVQGWIQKSSSKEATSVYETEIAETYDAALDAVINRHTPLFGKIKVSLTATERL